MSKRIRSRHANGQIRQSEAGRKTRGRAITISSSPSTHPTEPSEDAKRRRIVRLRLEKRLNELEDRHPGGKEIWE